MAFIRQIIENKMTIDLFKKSIDENKPLFIKSYMNYDFMWEDVIDMINQAHNNSFGNEVPEDIKSASVYNHNFKKLTFLKIPGGPVTFMTEDILREGYNIDSEKYDSIKEMKDILTKLDSDSSVHAKFSINMSTASTGLGPHRDTHHVLLTQLIGNAKYIIHDSKHDDPYGKEINVDGRYFTEYKLEKNDILFMPYGTIHSIDNDTIRVACIFDIIKKANLN
jgi:ribosomal protein L16 Arg81 hydroxylase